MKWVVVLLGVILMLCGVVALNGVQRTTPTDASASVIPWPEGLPRYDHVVIVIEENKDYDQIIGASQAPYINALRKQGANFTRMFAEEHNSEGNYFWLFSGGNHNVGFIDKIPAQPFATPNLGQALIANGRSFKGYAESLPNIGSTVTKQGLYARKHVPWISFSNVPNGTTIANSSNLRFKDFPAKFEDLPTVSIVVPNLESDMHDGPVERSVPIGDNWLKNNLDRYYQWAKAHNSLLILTFDENDTHHTNYTGLTDPFAQGDTIRASVKRNRIATIFAGDHIKAGEYAEGKGITHVNILRTLEAMYGFPKAGAQQPNAAAGGISDDYIITDIYGAEK